MFFFKKKTTEESYSLSRPLSISKERANIRDVKDRLFFFRVRYETSMKKGIHPTYTENATITCACGALFETGSTTQMMKIEICSQCHPFYTGKKKFIDAGGRVDRFKKLADKSKVAKETHITLKMEKAKKEAVIGEKTATKTKKTVAAADAQ